MATKRKYNEVTLKTKYEVLKEIDKNRPEKTLPVSLMFLEVHLLFGEKTRKKSTKLFKILH